ncbi:MAG TPA: PA14 domain-containing protein, partial [Tepidisphaeraceae bacterium]|nr:PA14 domain-containing protein [Tepidisphaeraceae bacterium]
PETQGQSHQISNVTIGPDNKLYVHVGDGFDASTAMNLDQYRGKILRMNKNGTPVSTGDPAGANPFYNASNGINSRDYIYTYGHRNPFGGAWNADGKHWIVENGNGIDRLTDLVSGQSYGWSGSDSALATFSKYVWNPSTAPVNIDFVESTKFGGSMFPAETFGHAFVSLSGSTYASGPLQDSKGIVEFSDLTTLGTDGKLATPPNFFVKYNGTGRATVAAIAAGPDGIYFSDLYEDTGANGATASGSNIYRVRYVGSAGGAVPTVANAAAASPNPVVVGSTTSLSVLGADDGGESNLTYTWQVLGDPPAPVAFSNNGTNAARNSTATFYANGTYNLIVAIRDAGGQTALSSIAVTVNSFLSEIGNGVSGAYYNNIDFTNLFATRVDPVIDFNWDEAAPIQGMGVNTFSIRWTGFIVPRFTETYTFYTTTDDGARLRVNNNLIIDAWFDQGATTFSGTITLNAGQLYPIQFDYFENGGAASARLEWSSASQLREVVQQGRLYSTAPIIPSAPTALSLNSPLVNRIDLSWTDNSNNESGFRIERSIDGNNFVPVGTTPAGVTQFHDTGLTSGTTYFYRVRSVNPAGASAALSGNLTTQSAPVISLAQFDVLGPNAVFTFDQPIDPSTVQASDLQITLLPNTTSTNATSFTLSPDHLTLSFKLPTNLANGNYRFRLGAGAIVGENGGAIAQTDLTGANVYILAGDVNRDRSVNFNDLLIVAQNYGQSNRTFAQGNINYSADGLVDFSDLLIIAQGYGTSLMMMPRRRSIESNRISQDVLGSPIV